ncbi:Sphingolipid delta(4)-desaturase DES1-like [Balamuthia mandrillaris]
MTATALATTPSTCPASKEAQATKKEEGNHRAATAEDGKRWEEEGDYRPDYVRVEHPQMHRSRRQQILKKYPAIKDLQRPSATTALWTLLLVVGQTWLAWFCQDYHPALLFLLGYFVGAFIDHALWVLIHDYTHEAVFSSSPLNKFFLILCDLPHLWPGGISFRHFHRLHHGHLNETYNDPDLPSLLEDRLFGRSALGKASWLLFFPLIQSIRMSRYTAASFLDPWFSVNILMNAAYTYAAFLISGWGGLVYLFVSTLFSIGLHPLGARWVAEHYSFAPDQETFSYYGSANLVSFNIGYHNEHHDFPRVPWNLLPSVKKAAPDFYDNLKTHNSYVALLFNFIFNPNFTLRSRVVRNASGSRPTKEE